MKPRDIFVIILMVGITGGLVWWMWRPSAEEVAAAKTTAHADGSNASSDGTGMAGSAKSAGRNAPADNDSMKSASDTADASPTDDTTAADKTKSTDDGMTASTTANPGGDPGANGPRAATAKGLQFVANPDGGVGMVLATLQRDTARDPRLVRQLGDVNALQVMPPLPIYTLSVVALRNGKSLDDAATNGGKFPRFYYIIDSSGNPVAGIIVGMGTGAMYGESNYNGIGVDFTAISAALNQLAANDQVSAGSYEARFLNVPNAMVIWLKSDTEANADLIYTVPTKANPTGTLYNAADYVQSLLSPAN